MGSKVKDFEDRYDTSLDGLMPAYTKATQKLSEYEKRELEAESQNLQSRAQQGQLSPEEQERMGRQILNQWGFVSKDDIPSIVEEQLEGVMVAREAMGFAQRVEADGKPSVTPEELIREMERTGLGMEEAYTRMFPSRLADWENSRINESREPGMYSQTAGAQSRRNPEPVRVTADNIEELADKALNNEL